MEIAFDEFLPEALAREPKRRPWRDGDPPLPALYISHGAPPLFEDRALAQVAASILGDEAPVVPSAFMS